MPKIEAITAALAAQHGAIASSINVKSEKLAIITLEFADEFAIHYEIKAGATRRID